MEQADNAIDHWRVLEVKRELRNVRVRWRANGDLVGRVTDALVLPHRGEAVGLSVQGSDQREYVIHAGNFLFREEQIWITPEVFHPATGLENGVVRAGETLTGTMVLTNEGYLLGYVRRIYLRLHSRQVIYQLAEGFWDRCLGRGFFIPGHIVRGYSRDGTRMIVPFNARDQYATSTLSGLMISQESEQETAFERGEKEREQ